MGPRSRTIRISQDVFRRLQERAKPLEDTPNSVIEELLDRDDRYAVLRLKEEATRSQGGPGAGDMEMSFSDLSSTEKPGSEHLLSMDEGLDGFSDASELVGSQPITSGLTELERNRLLEAVQNATPEAAPLRRIILAPSASISALEHYENTIKGPVPLPRIKTLVTDEEWQQLIELYPNGQAQIWGARPGPRNRKNFARIKDNDIVLFYRNQTYFSSYRVTTKLGRQATELAKELWGTDSDGNTWDLIYFLSDGRDENIKVGDLWKISGQGPRSLVRGLWILDRAPSARCIEHFGLER